jgi:Lon protease-like protein
MPLHIFEGRYRAMLQDALAGDRLIAMALLLDCGRKEYENKPPFHATVCVGHILEARALPNGRSNIVLMGVAAGHAEPTESGAPYRTARVTLEGDVNDLAPDAESLILRAGGASELGSGLESILPAADVPAAIVGACATAARIAAMDKLQLLEERSVQRRLERLVEFIERPWQWN